MKVIICIFSDAETEDITVSIIENCAPSVQLEVGDTLQGSQLMSWVLPALDKGERASGFRAIEPIGLQIPQTMHARHRVHLQEARTRPDNHMGSALLPHHIAPEQGGAHVVRGEAEVVALRVEKIVDAKVVIL